MSTGIQAYMAVPAYMILDYKHPILLKTDTSPFWGGKGGNKPEKERGEGG